MPSPTDVFRSFSLQALQVFALLLVVFVVPVEAQNNADTIQIPAASFSQSDAAPEAIFKPRADAGRGYRPADSLNQPAARVARGIPRNTGFVRQVAHLQANPNDELTVDAVQAELDSLDTQTGLDDEQRDRYLKTLTQSLKWLSAQQDSQKHLQQYKEQIKNAPAEIKLLRQNLNQPLPSTQVFVPAGASLSQLEAQITELDLQTQADQKRLGEISEKIDSRTHRVAAITKEISDLEKRIAEAKEVPVESDEEDLQSHVSRIESRARLQSLTAQLELLRVESKRFDALAEQWPLERDLADRQLSSSQQKLDAWKKTVEQWRRDESTRYAVATRQLADKSHPALKALATRNAEIAELRVHTAKEIQTISTEVTKLSNLKTRLEANFQSLQNKVEHAPQATSTGILLRKQKTELPQREKCDKRAARLHHDTPAAHLLLMELKDERRAISDPAATGQQLVSEMGEEIEEFDPQQVLRAVTVLLQTRRDLLAKLIADQDKLLRDLSELEVVNHDLSQQITGFRGFLDEHVLWVRSDEILGIKDLQKATVATGSLFQFSRWTAAVRAVVGETLRGPWAMGVAFALLLCAFTFRQHLSRRLKELCTPPVHSPHTPPQPMQFGMSLSGLAISILLSASWPAVLLAVGYKLSSAEGADEFTRGLGKALMAVSALVWGSQIIREICVENQVGHRMFGWPPRVLTSVRRTLELTVLVAAPLLGVLVMAQSVTLTGGESLHRLTLMLTLVFVAIQSYSLLRPGGSVMQAITRMSPNSMIAKMQRPICFALTAVPLILAGISAYGYHYSATQLSFRFAESLVAILGIIVLHALALRWLRLNGYNRTVREQYAKYQAKMESRESSAAAGDGDAEQQRAEAIEEQEVKWEETADIHIRELLRYVTVLTLLVGGWFIWAEVLPALRVLDRVTLWDNVVKVSEVISDSSGRSILQQIETSIPTTLKDAIVACLVVFGTLMIGKRMTSLLEVTVLQRLPIDMGGRHAVSILMRYALTLTGLLVACHMIRLSWSSVQWLAAAMTVGLGFGLQEIFANLVSGLIILFERPIRAGDIVTIGDVTGTVSRMQIRATTITDFDRRELIVPNKSFITGNVINWTLSDPVCRTIVHVGVAYGTDTARVESILLSVARRCPMVLDGPEPCVVFGGFGSSTLDFELRVFIGQRESRPQINSALYMAINREFNQAGVEIAFPQQDLHIRSVDGIKALEQSLTDVTGSKAA